MRVVRPLLAILAVERRLVALHRGQELLLLLLPLQLLDALLKFRDPGVFAITQDSHTKPKYSRDDCHENHGLPPGGEVAFSSHDVPFNMGRRR